MRLKKVKKGFRYLKFLNESNKDAGIYLDKKPFLLVQSNSWCLIDAETFVVGFPMKFFPDMQLYCSVYIKITCYEDQ